MARLTECKNCGDPIVFLLENGKNLPVDASSVRVNGEYWDDEHFRNFPNAERHLCSRKVTSSAHSDFEGF